MGDHVSSPSVSDGRRARWEAAAAAAGCEVDRGALAAYMAVADAELAEARRAVLLEAADYVGNDDTCDCGGCDTCVPRKLADGLRRMAAEGGGAG